jgi:hypothetical protein
VGRAEANAAADHEAIAATDFRADFDWAMPSRFGKDLGDDPTKWTDPIKHDGQWYTLSPSWQFIHTRTWKVTLTAFPPAGVSVRNYDWKIDGQFITQTQSSFDYEFPAQGTYPVELTINATDGRSGSVAKNVLVKDLLIVSLGDSVASGEGNPDDAGYQVLPPAKSIPPTWANRRCHRSMYSGPAQAAKAIEVADPHTSVTFVSLACSGASIVNGLLGTYNGIDPPDGSQNWLRSQLDELRRLVCPEMPPNYGYHCDHTLQRQIDALLINAGANDLQFSDIVEACVIGGLEVDLREWCKLFPANPLCQIGIVIGKRRIPTCDESEAVARSLFEKLQTLPQKYDDLKRAIDSAFKPCPVYLAEYFDPTRGANGEWCLMEPFLDPKVGLIPVPDAKIDPDESRWASDYVVSALNNRIFTKAREFGWNHVGGIAKDFQAHGYCSSDPWIVRNPESWHRQLDLFGTMHPNHAGHQNYKKHFVEEISKNMAATLHLEGAIESADCDQITGWAVDRSRPYGSIYVDIYADGNYLATVLADKPGKTVYQRAFSYSVPTSLKDNKPHRITVRFSGLDALKFSGMNTEVGSFNYTCGMKVTNSAVQLIPDGSPVEIKAPVMVTTPEGQTNQTTTFFTNLSYGNTITLKAQPQLTVGGVELEFVGWEIDSKPQWRKTDNPLSQAIYRDTTIVARYLRKSLAALTVKASTEDSSNIIFLSAPVSYQWSPRPGLSSGGTQNTLFEIYPPRSVTVKLEAPLIVKHFDQFLKFSYWEVGGKTVAQNILYHNAADDSASLWAHYQNVQPAFDGLFEKLDCGTISGWAWDRNQPNIPVKVDVYVDGKAVATITANQFRQDLLNTGFGNGSHGFTYSTPADLRDGKPHAISVRHWGTTTDLRNSPRPITIGPAPVITDEPDDVKVCVGAPARIAVAARGEAPRYEWWKDGQRLAASGSALNFNAVTKADEGIYQVKVIDACGRSVSSRIARLTVGGEIAITTQPVNLVRCPGQMAVFAVTATGGNLTYQWRKNGVAIPNATERVYSIPAVAPGDAGTYHVVINNGCDLVESSRVTLTVSPPPAISPANQLFRYLGGNGKFNITGAGCLVTAVSNVPWIKITSGPGTGNFRVDFTVESNFGPERVGAITVDGATHTVTQLPRDVVKDAWFVVQQVYPVSMKAGQRYTVMIKMRNLGTATWTTAAGYKLISQSPPNNTTWGLSSVELPGGSVAPGAEVTFSFEITAPATPGFHTFQWRMAQNGAGFGDSTEALQLIVNRN